ncbi:MAG: hypothetical protein V3U84_02355 [Thiotrichaceae bacterium]
MKYLVIVFLFACAPTYLELDSQLTTLRNYSNRHYKEKCEIEAMKCCMNTSDGKCGTLKLSDCPGLIECRADRRTYHDGFVRAERFLGRLKRREAQKLIEQIEEDLQLEGVKLDD